MRGVLRSTGTRGAVSVGSAMTPPSDHAENSLSSPAIAVGTATILNIRHHNDAPERGLPRILMYTMHNAKRRLELAGDTTAPLSPSAPRRDCCVDGPWRCSANSR